MLHAFERACERTGRAFRPQSEIDPQQRALGIGRGKALQNFFAEAIEELMIRETRRELALVAVNKDKIDIGTVVQLAPAKFAQRQNRKFRFGRAVLLAKLTVPVVEYAPDADFGDLRKLSRRFFERGGTGYFAQSDPHQLASFPAAQRAKILPREGIDLRHLRASAGRLADIGPLEPE